MKLDVNQHFTLVDNGDNKICLTAVCPECNGKTGWQDGKYDYCTHCKATGIVLSENGIVFAEFVKILLTADQHNHIKNLLDSSEDYDY